MKRLISVVGMVLALASLSWGVDVRILSLNEGAPKGATHCVKITHADLTATGTNGTAQTLTNVFAVAAKQGVECIAAVLKTPFTYSTTNGLSSVTLEVGDGDDTDLYLGSMELCSHGTEVFLKFGRGDEAALTQTTTNLPYVASPTGVAIPVITYAFTTVSTNLLDLTTNAIAVSYLSAVTPTTNTYTLLTNQTFGVTSVLKTDTVATGVYGKKLYTAADYVDFVFTPTGTYWSLADLDAGEVWIYFKVWDGAKN